MDPASEYYRLFELNDGRCGWKWKKLLRWLRCGNLESLFAYQCVNSRIPCRLCLAMREMDIGLPIYWGRLRSKCTPDGVLRERLVAYCSQVGCDPSEDRQSLASTYGSG